MFSKRNRQPAGAIDLSDLVDELRDAKEVMRVFMPRGDAGPISGIYIDPPDNFTPFMFGILLADLVHHCAKAFADKFGMDEAEALYEVSLGLSAELANPTDEVQQVTRESDA